MNLPLADDRPLDIVDELRLRRFAREHYVPLALRHRDWNRVILDEMARRDFELCEQAADNSAGARIVPLAPEPGLGDLAGPHLDPARALLLARIPALSDE